METLITCLTNWKTTLIGFVAGIALYVVANGVKMPTDAQGWWTFAFAALVAGLGFVCKDATTGSRPKMVLVPLLALLTLTGCTTAAPGGNASLSGLAALQQFTVADLTAALTSAIKHEDEVAGRCWMTLLPIVQAGLPAAEPIKGLASALQTKRNLLGQGGDDQVAALRKRVTLGCSALFLEENRELLKLGVSAFPGGGALGGLLR